LRAEKHQLPTACPCGSVLPYRVAIPLFSTAHPGRPEIVPPIVDKNTSVFDWIENSFQKGKPSRRTPIWLVTTFHTYPEPNPRLAGSETGASVTMTTDWVSLIGVQFQQSEFVEVK
jgi:hypothetical protein